MKSESSSIDGRNSFVKALQEELPHTTVTHYQDYGSNKIVFVVDDLITKEKFHHSIECYAYEKFESEYIFHIAKELRRTVIEHRGKWLGENHKPVIFGTYKTIDDPWSSRVPNVTGTVIGKPVANIKPAKKPVEAKPKPPKKSYDNVEDFGKF